MRPVPTKGRVVLVALVGLAGCGGASSPLSPAGAAGASSAGSAGTVSSGGGGVGSAGAPMDGGATGGEGGAGVSADGSAGSGGAAAGDDGAAGSGGAPAVVDLTKVVAAGTGCGKDAPADLVPGMLVQQSITTMGDKGTMCADSKCGAWTDTREYFVRLPTGYDKNKPYPIVFEGPGCGGRGNGLYQVPLLDSTVIRVGLTPSAYWQKYHSTNPNQGCFDDKEGDDSVDWVFYEDLYDLLAATTCFDRNRVFFAGTSSGAWLANEAGCKYAGAAKYAVRGVMPNTGGLPTDAKYVPTCTDQALAGLWIRDTYVGGNQIDTSLVAINRALDVDGCMPTGVSFANAMYESFPVGGDATTCKKVTGCSAVAPVAVCTVAASLQTSNGGLVAEAWPAFLALFSKAPLLTP